MVRVRDAKPEELAPKPRKPRALSPRQLAIKRREQAIEKVLNELGAGPASWIKKIELEDNEKLVTIRAAVARQIVASGSAVNLGVRNGAIFLSRGPIPGGRGGRRILRLRGLVWSTWRRTFWRMWWDLRRNLRLGLLRRLLRRRTG